VEHTALLLASGLHADALAGFAKCTWPTAPPPPPAGAAPLPAVPVARHDAGVELVAVPAAVCGAVGALGLALALRAALRARAARAATAAATADADVALQRKARDCDCDAKERAYEPAAAV
jgi:hypothetical protein